MSRCGKSGCCDAVVTQCVLTCHYDTANRVGTKGGGRREGGREGGG